MPAALAAALLMTGLVTLPGAARAQELPPLLPEADEIALARSAAPAAISDHADIWVLRRGGHVKVVSGTSGVACIVTRDHPGSLYPMCYDRIGANTILPIAIRRQQLREDGGTTAQIDAAIETAIASGDLNVPDRTAVSWMQSGQQVIYNGADGPRVGAWKPHIMIYMPYATPESLGFGGMSDGDMGLRDAGKPTAHMIIISRDWSAGG